MEFESTHSNTTAKLPILKLGEYEMWVTRIKQYFQVQDYALWEVIENGNSWVSVPQTSQENGTSVTKITSSTNDVNTAKPAYEVNTVSPNVNTTSPQVSTASFSDNVVYAFMVENPNGSNLLQQDLEQIHEDDLEAIYLK
ncbi:hypothetical protein Tco_1528147 [Tanacetum coccineum]